VLKTFAEICGGWASEDGAGGSQATGHRERGVAVTIHQVAQAAKVSVSTVSRALNAPDQVSPETRRVVREVAERLGYQPNRAARGLISGRTGNLGLVVPDIANPFFPPMVKAAQTRAQIADYAVFLCDTDEDPHTEIRALRTMAKQVDGVVVCSPRLNDEQTAEVVGLTKVVFLNRRVPGVPAVLMDNADGMRQAVDHLAALGHRRCAYLDGPRTSWSNQERRNAAVRFGAQAGLEVVTLGPFAPRYEAGLHAADPVIAAEVTAVLAYNDLLALGVLTRLAARGVRVPDQVSVVGFDDIAMAGMAAPPLTTVAVPSAAAGRAAVEALLEMLAGDHTEPRVVELPTQLMVRASTSPPPAT
jgi:DNA-binding LacI/PurR family transcriptional regulator